VLGIVRWFVRMFVITFMGYLLSLFREICLRRLSSWPLKTFRVW
jgi:hypothetical protein